MNAADFKPFCSLLDATYDLLGKTPAAKLISADSKAIFFRALEQYTFAEVRAGLDAHAREGTYTPVPNDVRAHIEARRPVQWIPADEAWARIPRQEGAPGLLNQVTAPALAVAAPFLAEGDENAARMAFRACYNRLSEQAKLHGSAPEYFLSPGGSFEEQQDVLVEGARQGLIAGPAASVAPRLGHSAPPPGALEALRTFRLKSMPTQEE